MRTSTLSHTVQETTCTKEQEKLHQHKEEQACLKETMRKMGDLFEEVCMDVETEDQCIQDIGHTFMTPHGILDKDFSQEINKNLPRLAATQFPVSRNILVHERYKINMDSKNDWEPFSYQRKAEMQQFQDSLICNQLNKNHFSHAWKQTYEQINDFCDAFCIPYKSRNKFYIKELEFLALYIHDILPEDRKSVV